ncbi:hypothetical protein J2T08_005807 [Neorhizobium galegae]|nr:hypothetical protein [Neorhizobium galegae]
MTITGVSLPEGDLLRPSKPGKVHIAPIFFSYNRTISSKA